MKKHGNFTKERKARRNGVRSRRPVQRETQEVMAELVGVAVDASADSHDSESDAAGKNHVLMG